jgi:hypothetical protein
MKTVLLSGLAVALVGLTTTRTEAFGGHCGESHCPGICFVEKKITCYKPEFKTEQYTVTVNKFVCKEVCTKEKVTVMVPKQYEEKRTCTTYVKCPKVIEKEVKHLRIFKVEMVDPCTGCKYTCCRPVHCTEKVKCTVYEKVPQTKEYTVKVCKMEPVCKEVDVRKTVRECVPETVTRCRTVCRMVPYQTCIKCPVLIPCAKPCCK